MQCVWYYRICAVPYHIPVLARLFYPLIQLLSMAAFHTYYCPHTLSVLSILVLPFYKKHVQTYLDKTLPAAHQM